MSSQNQNERSYQYKQGQLTCHRDTNRAEAVCGECGTPLCENHSTQKLLFIEKVFRDWSFSRFRGGQQPLIKSVVLLIALPLAWVFVEPLTLVENAGISPPASTGRAVLHSSIILGFAFTLKLWGQGSDENTSIRLLYREPPKRVLCKSCFDDNFLQVIIGYTMLGLSVLVMLAGVYLAWNSKSLGALRLSVVGLGIFVIRHDVTLYIVKFIE